MDEQNQNDGGVGSASNVNSGTTSATRSAVFGPEPPPQGPVAASSSNSSNTNSGNTNAPSATLPQVRFQIRNGRNGHRIVVQNPNGQTTTNGPQATIRVGGGNVTTNRPTQQHHRIAIPVMSGQPPVQFSSRPPSLPPLEPRPVAHQHASNTQVSGSDEMDGNNGEAVATNQAESGEQETPLSGNKRERLEANLRDMKKFECAICFEYMDGPSGCGSCQTRFCRVCLERVLWQELARRPPQSNDPPNSARCPHCRSFFSEENIVLDESLQKEINDCTETVTCPFAGCGKELRVGLLKSHEEKCPHMRMRCKYADWGCQWVGKKMDMDGHNERECEFRGGLGTLVERFRQSETNNNHALQQQHMQLAATNRMLYLQNRQMLMIRGKNAGNIFDVIQLAFEASCFPGRFAVSKEIWGNVVLHEGPRCLVCTLLSFIPTLALTLHVTIRGFQILTRMQLRDALSEEVWAIVDMFLLSLIMGLLGILCSACFYLDSKSPYEWTVYYVRGVMTGQPILRDVAACSMAMIHFSALEFLGWHPGILLWHLTTIVTILFPSFVGFIIEKNSGAENVAKSSRAHSVVSFGLRYSIIVWCCGFIPTAVAVISLRLIRSLCNLPLYVTSEDSECFLSQLDGDILTYVAIAAASFYSACTMYEFNLEPVISSVAAFILLAYVNWLVFLLHEVGRKCGKANYQHNTSLNQSRIDNGSVLPSQRPAPVGVMVFGACSFLLMCVGFA